MSEPADTAKGFRAAAPAGAAALAIVAAVIGGTVLLRPTPDAPASPPFEQTFSASPAHANPGPVSSDAVTSGSVDGGAHGAGPGPGLPGIQFDQAGASSGKPALSAEIVVKFKDDRKVQDMVDMFWKDAPAARKKFEAFRLGRPEFAGVKLVRVTYSNELVLAPITDMGPDKRAAQVRDLASKMGKAPDIAYAEANVTAKPGGR